MGVLWNHDGHDRPTPQILQKETLLMGHIAQLGMGRMSPLDRSRCANLQKKKNGPMTPKCNWRMAHGSSET
jgi:hypothetical protein